MRPKGSQKTPGSGRKKGGKNHLTTALKDMILQALANVGGIAYLETAAKDHPAVFLALVGRVLPLQVKDGGDEPRVPQPVEVHLHQGPPPAVSA